MSGTRRADLLRAIVVREEARIDQALHVLNGLLDSADGPVERADQAGTEEAPPRSARDEPTEGVWTLMHMSMRAVSQRIAFELRWRPMRVRKRLRLVREHYQDLKRFEEAAQHEAATRRNEERFLQERSERRRSSRAPASDGSDLE